MWGSWGIMMMIVMVLFWAAIIVGLVGLLRWLMTTGTPRHQGDTAIHDGQSSRYPEEALCAR